VRTTPSTLVPKSSSTATADTLDPCVVERLSGELVRESAAMIALARLIDLVPVLDWPKLRVERAVVDQMVLTEDQVIGDVRTINKGDERMCEEAFMGEPHLVAR
jgi:hypothetical protein